MNKFIVSLFAALFLTTMPSFVNAESEMIILASPALDDDYYNDVEGEIFDFHINFARQLAPDDRVLVLTDKTRAADYIEALGKESVLVSPMLDIWMRDFSLSNAREPIMFRYTAVAHDDQDVSDEVQDVFYELVKEVGLAFKESDLLNDGGNFVDDYYGNVVLSTKFLKDNKLSELEARAILTQYDSIKHVAFIEADEQGGLEHADGVVSFIDENTLIVNKYPEDPDYAEQLKNDLKRGLPDVTIHEVDAPYNDEVIYDDRFGSACGLYTNALVTLKRIYLPQFGVPEDKKVLEQVRTLTTKEVIPISSEQICFMGGGVRCMSWQLRGKNAQRFIDYLSNGT